MVKVQTSNDEWIAQVRFALRMTKLALVLNEEPEEDQPKPIKKVNSQVRHDDPDLGRCWTADPN